MFCSQGLHGVINYIKICTFKNYEIIVLFQSVIYIYIIKILCVCVSVKYRGPNGWTDHDQIWHVYADRPGNGSYQKNGPTCGPEGWAHWGHSSKRVLSWRAASYPSSDSEPLAKQREEL